MAAPTPGVHQLHACTVSIAHIFGDAYNACVNNALIMMLCVCMCAYVCVCVHEVSVLQKGLNLLTIFKAYL